MAKNKKITKRFKKLSCFTFALCIFLSLSLAGCSSNKDKTDITKKVTTESSKDKKDDSIFQDSDKSKDNASNSTSSTTDNNTSTKDNTAQSTTPATTTQQTNTNSTPAQAPAQTTTKAESNNNRTVYYVPNSNVYHYSKSDGTLKKSKTILEMTEGEALAKGMHLTQSKSDQH